MLLLAGLAGCSRPDENQAPELAYAHINDSSGRTVAADVSVPLAVAFSASDDQALRQVHIQFHAADDGHLHPGLARPARVHPNTGLWDTVVTAPLSGQTANKIIYVDLPGHIGGNWHAGITLLDEGGAVSSTAYFRLDIHNAQLPEFDFFFTAPPMGSRATLTAPAGSILVLNGSVHDNIGLERVQGCIIQNGDTLTALSVEAGGLASLDLSSMDFSAPVEAGNYQLHWFAADTDGNETRRNFPLIVLP